VGTVTGSKVLVGWETPASDHLAALENQQFALTLDHVAIPDAHGKELLELEIQRLPRQFVEEPFVLVHDGEVAYAVDDDPATVEEAQVGLAHGFIEDAF
jgi:hypothetical protein